VSDPCRRRLADAATREQRLEIDGGELSEIVAIFIAGVASSQVSLRTGGYPPSETKRV
jgi:hypothetical protein